MQQTDFAPAFQIKFTAAPKQFSANFGFLFFSFANSIQFNLIILPIAARKNRPALPRYDLFVECDFFATMRRRFRIGERVVFF
jgi:hypothetical protein